jgi:hypothetical protein
MSERIFCRRFHCKLPCTSHFIFTWISNCIATWTLTWTASCSGRRTAHYSRRCSGSCSAHRSSRPTSRSGSISISTWLLPSSGGGIGGVGKITGATGLGIRNLGRISPAAGICTIIHIETRLRAAILTARSSGIDCRGGELQRPELSCSVNGRSAATGIASYVLPSSTRPFTCLRVPPHCLK